MEHVPVKPPKRSDGIFEDGCLAWGDPGSPGASRIHSSFLVDWSHPIGFIRYPIWFISWQNWQAGGLVKGFMIGWMDGWMDGWWRGWYSFLFYQPLTAPNSRSEVSIGHKTKKNTFRVLYPSAISKVLDHPDSVVQHHQTLVWVSTKGKVLTQPVSQYFVKSSRNIPHWHW